MLLGGRACCTPNFSFIILHCSVSHTNAFGRGLVLYIYSSSFRKLFYHPSLLYQSMILGGGGCCIPNFSFIILHCSVITPLIGGWFYTYIVFFFQELRLSSFMSLPFHTFRKTPFNHSFLSKGIEFSAFFKNLFYHPSLLSQSMLSEGVDVACQSFLLSSCIALSFHTTRKNYSTLIHPFGRGWVLHTFIYTYISFRNLFYHPSCLSQSTLLEKCHSTSHSFLKGLNSLYFSAVSFIILHCPINPCFWEGVHVASQAFLLSSCIALSFHKTKKNTLLTPLIGDRIL